MAKNYAFIDGQNLYLGMKELGWNLDLERFRRYLKEKYQVNCAYYFIGYVPKNIRLYQYLQRCGYNLIFKPTVLDQLGKIKGNVDAEIVLQAMIDFPRYDQAVLVSSDGDFYCLVNYWQLNRKLKMILSPHLATCSSLLKRAAKDRILYMDNLAKKLGRK